MSEPLVKPRFSKFQRVLMEHRPGGISHVKDVEYLGFGTYRYLIERTETFFAYEQSLKADGSAPGDECVSPSYPHKISG